MEPFRLQNDPPRVAKPDYDDGECDRQRVLFAGLDCLPGQMDLFETDGDHTDFEWEAAQPGDIMPDGSLLIQRKMRRKADAQRLADKLGGRVLIDGPRSWAVTNKNW